MKFNRTDCRMQTITFAFIVLLLIGCVAAVADNTWTKQRGDQVNWPDWRGPTGDGRSDATDLPLNWSESENIVWKTRIHDLGR
ncbi:MAG: hypothetical protein ACYSYL_04085 [Planctomycetota bacterium]